MSGSMENVFKKENKGFQRIYVDLPGMGKSSVNPAIKTADDVVGILLDFIDAVLPERNFLLVGESWGGALCRGILEHRKDSVAGLCLLCPVTVSGRKDIERPVRTVIEKDEMFLETLTERERKLFTSLSVVQTRKCWKAFKRDVYGTLIKNNEEYLGHILKGEFRDHKYLGPFTFEKPVLILTGRQDVAVGYKEQTEYFMDFPRATLAVVDKAGHNLQIEQEGVFHALLADWLRRVRSYRP
jgi:pimeloyl-ACP methyl ester carboxylesterase